MNNSKVSIGCLIYHLFIIIMSLAFKVITSNAKGYSQLSVYKLLPVSSGVIYGMPEVEPESLLCKASSLSLYYLSHHPRMPTLHPYREDHELVIRQKGQ